VTLCLSARLAGVFFSNFIHFLSAKFNLFDAREKFFKPTPEAVCAGADGKAAKKGHEKKKEKLGILIMHINYVSQQFFAFFSSSSSRPRRARLDEEFRDVEEKGKPKRRKGNKSN
jgi:hypothetical protein